MGIFRKKLEPGSPLRGRGTPAYPARLRSERARNLGKLVFVFVAAQEFVALDGSDNADCALVARFRPLDASETAHPNRPGKSDLVWKGQ